MEISPEIFLEKFRSTIKYSQSYVRPGAIQELCKEGVFSREEALVFKVLVRKFMQEEFPVSIMHQSKMKKTQKVAYLKLSRVLYKQIIANFFK